MRFAAAAFSDWKGWPRNVRLFFLSNMLYQFGTGLFSVLYNLYIHELGYADSMSGTVVGLQSLATALCFLPIGLFGDRVSRRTLLMIGALGSGVVLSGRSLLESEGGLLTLAVLTGLFATVFQVLAIPFLADNVAKKRRRSSTGCSGRRGAGRETSAPMRYNRTRKAVDPHEYEIARSICTPG